MRSVTIYHQDGSKTEGSQRPKPYGYDDSERLQIEGTQGERVLRGYREIEAAGRFREGPARERPSQIKRAWAPEITGRFK